MFSVLSRKGLELSTNCRWWDFGNVFHSRLVERDLNDPPTAVGGFGNVLDL